MKPRLFTPGPTPVPENIQLLMARPMIHHRNEDFQEFLSACHTKLQYLFQTTSPVVILSGSGTSGMESLVSSVFGPGEEAVFVNGGKFGERWGELLVHYQIPTYEITKNWGTPVTASEIISVLEAHPKVSTVFLTHSETSTGTFTDIKTISLEVKKKFPEVKVIVDGITSVGSHELKMDEWQLDAVVTGSQKGLMIPPGLALVAVRTSLVEKISTFKSKSFYLSLQDALKAHSANDTPWTPAVSLIIGLKYALEMIEEEGIEKVWVRHQILGESVRRGVTALGLKLFSESPSNAVTPVFLPEGIEWKKFNSHLKKKDGITIAGGQGPYTGKIFRLSHLGYYDAFDMITIMAAIERALSASGYKFTIGAGVAATHHFLLENLEK